MKSRRLERVNALLKEVIMETLQRHVKHPDLPQLTTVTSVKVTHDLRQAVVYISIMAPPEEQQKALKALTHSAGFIAVKAAQQVELRFFPNLIFQIDYSIERAHKIETLLKKLSDERPTGVRDEGEIL